MSNDIVVVANDLCPSSSMQKDNPPAVASDGIETAFPPANNALSHIEHTIEASWVQDSGSCQDSLSIPY